MDLSRPEQLGEWFDRDQEAYPHNPVLVAVFRKKETDILVYIDIDNDPNHYRYIIPGTALGNMAESWVDVVNHCRDMLPTPEDMVGIHAILCGAGTEYYVERQKAGKWTSRIYHSYGMSMSPARIEKWKSDHWKTFPTFDEALADARDRSNAEIENEKA